MEEGIYTIGVAVVFCVCLLKRYVTPNDIHRLASVARQQRFLRIEADSIQLRAEALSGTLLHMPTPDVSTIRDLYTKTNTNKLTRAEICKALSILLETVFHETLDQTGIVTDIQDDVTTRKTTEK